MIKDLSSPQAQGSGHNSSHSSHSITSQLRGNGLQDYQLIRVLMIRQACSFVSQEIQEEYLRLDWMSKHCPFLTFKEIVSPNLETELCYGIVAYTPISALSFQQ